MPRRWFGKKRIGQGLHSTSWEGLALSALYIVLVAALGVGLGLRHPTLFLLLETALTVGYLAVALLISGAGR